MSNACSSLHLQGNEAKDIYLGDLFAFAAIARAMRDRVDAGGAPPDTATVGHIVEELAQLAGRKGARRRCPAALARVPSTTRLALLEMLVLQISHKSIDTVNISTPHRGP